MPETAGKTTRGADTKARIVDETLRLIGEHGVAGTSTARIAAAVGVSEPALYRHFKNRHEMILAALDALYSLILEINDSSSNPNAVECLRDIAQTHMEYAYRRHDVMVSSFLAFITSPVETGYRREFEIRQEAATNALTAIVEQGKAQGTIRDDVDAHETAWELVGAFWADIVARGVNRSSDKRWTARMVDTILESISVDGTKRSNGLAAGQTQSR